MDREGFKNRMKQYKQAREENPGLKYYDFMERLAEFKAKEWNDDPDMVLLHMLNDNSYNYQQMYEDNPNFDIQEGHFVDTYKTAYHPTFSEESVYSGKKSQYNPEGIVGGSWDESTRSFYLNDKRQSKRKAQDYLNHADPGYTAIPKYDEGTGGVFESYYKPSTVEGVLAKTAVQLADPTGVSSYPDVFYSGKELWNNPSWDNANDFVLNFVSALPLIGKVTAPFKAAKMAKMLARIEDANALVKGIEQSARINKVIDTVPEMIPVVRRAAEKTQDVTSALITDPLFNTWSSANKFDKVRQYRNANAAVDAINVSNNSADIGQGISELKSFAEGGEVTDPIENPVLPQSHDPYFTQWQANWLNNRRKQLYNNLDNMTYDHRRWLFKSDEGVEDDIIKGRYDVKQVDDSMFKDFGRLLMGYSPERIRVNEEFYRQLNNSATAPEITLNEYDSKYAGVYVKPNSWNNTGHYIAYVKNTTLSDKVHERTHASHADPQKDAISKIINYDKKTLKGHDKYLKDPSEIYSRLMEYRHNNKLKPSQVIDLDYLNAHREQLKLHRLNMFTDDELLNMFNNVAENTVEENRTYKSKRA